MLERAKLLEGALGGAFVAVEALIEAAETLLEIVVGDGLGVLLGLEVVGAFGIGEDGGVEGELGVPDLGLEVAEAADAPFVLHDGVDEVALARGDGAEFPVVFVGEAGEIGGIFAEDDLGFGMDAGFQGIHAGGLFAGVRAGAGGELRIATIRFDLSVS